MLRGRTTTIQMACARRRVTWISVTAVLAIACHAASASAQRASLAVLGLATEEGDDARAAALTAALRDQALQDPHVRLSSSRALLSQMTLLQDCEIADPACRTRIGEGLKSDEVIYGSLRREGVRGHAVELHLFQTRDGSEVSAHRMIPAADTSDAALAEHARALLDSLRGRPEPAPPNVNDGGAGPLPVPTITPDVEPLVEDETLSAAESVPPADVVASSNDWVGFSLLGVAAVSAGLTAFSWMQIDAANQDLVAYRNAVWQVSPRLDDVCAEAHADRSYGFDPAMLREVRETCGRGQTFEVLQYVFLGAALVSAGVGTYFLLDDDGPGAGRAVQRSPKLAIRAGRGTGMVSLRLDL